MNGTLRRLPATKRERSQACFRIVGGEILDLLKRIRKTVGAAEDKFLDYQDHRDQLADAERNAEQLLIRIRSLKERTQ